MLKLVLHGNLLNSGYFSVKNNRIDNMNIHNDIDNDIKFLAKSEIRLKILSELYNEPNNVRGIVKQTKITYSSVSSNIGKLEKHNFIKKVNDKYYVNPMTKVYFKSLMEFKSSIDIINSNNDFWNKHDLNQLTIDSIKNITDLKNSKLVEATPIEIYKTHNTIKRQMINSKNVKAIFPYLHPEYPKLIERVLKNNGSVELIIPKNIFKELVFRINGPIRRNAIKKGKLKIHNYKDELNLYLTLCDQNIGLSLFKNDGSFDQNRILVSNDPKSYNWAVTLFNQLKKEVIK